MSLKFFTTSNSKYIIATLRIVTIEKPELSFLLILSFHAICSIFKGVQGKAQRNCKRKKKKKKLPSFSPARLSFRVLYMQTSGKIWTSPYCPLIYHICFFCQESLETDMWNTFDWLFCLRYHLMQSMIGGIAEVYFGLSQT